MRSLFVIIALAVVAIASPRSVMAWPDIDFPDFPGITLPTATPTPTPTPPLFKLKLPLGIIGGATSTPTPSPSPTSTPTPTSTNTPAPTVKTESGASSPSVSPSTTPSIPSTESATPTPGNPTLIGAFGARDYVTWGLLIIIAVLLVAPKLKKPRTP